MKFSDVILIIASVMLMAICMIMVIDILVQ